MCNTLFYNLAHISRGSCSTSIEQISSVYGNQAVVISVDPTRVYVKSPNDVPVSPRAPVLTTCAHFYFFLPASHF